VKKYPAKKSATRDQYTVVLEDIRDQFRLFGDMQMGMNKKLDEHTKILGSHSKILNSHSQILDSHSKILESHTQMIGQLMVDMQEVKYELKKRPTFDDLKIIEKRLARLEAKI